MKNFSQNKKEEKVINRPLPRMTPVIAIHRDKYYVGYVDSYCWGIGKGNQYVVSIGDNDNYLFVKYDDIIEIANAKFLYAEDKLCKTK